LSFFVLTERIIRVGQYGLNLQDSLVISITPKVL
jgi:hypothetical protein